MDCNYCTPHGRTPIVGILHTSRGGLASFILSLVHCSVLQAAIVRVMKMRRVLVYNMLIKETIDLAATRFKPSVASIKRAIEVSQQAW